ncbi:phosphatidylinositol-3,5-bisphosphate 3-phosphatase MTMR6 [Salarias fasciatus]|uniref:Myotubularin phosphatase domain-containing protein n=1 Tax=Salarias fasciatus TaxID=181472 RepID=A0A672ILX2_SALFA|nr:myotubularin-related protein 6 [Salarias fasciatus]
MEHIRTPKVEQVRLQDRFSNKSTNGTLYLTATHLIFVESSSNGSASAGQEIWILHHHIASVEKLSLTTSGCPLVIQCRNFRVVHFVVPRERDCHDIYSSLLRLLRPVGYEELYAFSYNPKQNDQQREEGWQLIDLGAEFERMGVPCDQWQLTDVNRHYKVCETYPRDLYVPITASKPIIVGSSKFRSKGRFPVLTYFYQEKKAAVCRCSQPLSGFSARCLEDESLLQAISKANHNSRFVYVMDTRPKLNALANRAAGKGYENEDNYSNIRFQFVGIENIHVMRSSLQKLLEVVGTRSLSMSDYLVGLESCGWLRHIKAVVDAAIFLTKAVTVEGASVLVHCSDGWDRTAQVCSLGALLMDPYYRTVKGFMVLIEKDWISFGHKFADRCDQLDGDPKEVSPIFTQFLECVWQLTEQFPQAFEFSEWFLLQIHEHVHSCQYGNFLGNNQRQREELQLRERTHSLWAFLMSEKQNYLNPFYSPAYSEAHPVLEPSTLPYHFKFWRNMYHQFDRSMHPRQSILKTILTLRENSRKAESTLQALETRLQQLGVTPVATSDPPAPPPTRDQRTNPNALPPRPDSLILGAPVSQKEAQRHEEEDNDNDGQEDVGEEAVESTDTERTVEGSSGTESRKQSYGELEGTYNNELAKEEPAVVSLEFGVARMTC